MTTLAVVSGEGAGRDAAPVARCCGRRGEEAGAGGRRGRCWAGAGGGPGLWPGQGFPPWGGMGGSGRQRPGPEPRGGRGGGRSGGCRPVPDGAPRPGRAINAAGARSLPPRLASPSAAACPGARGGDGARGGGVWVWGVCVCQCCSPRPPHPPGHGGSVPAGKGGRRPGGPRRGGAGPSRARRSRHTVSHPLDSFPKKHFLLSRSGVKACVGRAGAHSPRVVGCRRRRWGAGAPCPGAELPRHPAAPTAPVPSPPRHDPAALAARMKRCCPGAAWVILAALWLAASESQPPRCRDRSVPWAQRVLVRPPSRPRRHATRPPCPAGMNWIEGARRCCTQCPAGTFLVSPCSGRGNDSVCTACPAGTFRAQPNTFSECQACYECDRQAFQRVLSNCSATSNVACGCEPGRFRDCLDERCSDFSCRQCQPCTGRLIQRPCSEAQDALCGSCKPDFYAEGSECRPCRTSAPETCGKECQRACGGGGGGSGLEYVLLALTGPLFLGALAIYHKRKRLRHDDPAGAPTAAARAATPATGAAATSWCQVRARVWDGQCWTQPCSLQLTEHAAGTARRSPEHRPLLREQPGGAARPGGEAEPSAPPEPRGALLQGSQLYAVIDAVPVRRWKEFMRVLELREAEIELVELEVAHIRDQQYEMLKRWCQQTSATLDRVFAALERMELAGCAEALRRSLPVGP
ncbi:tumor necrosis factor receptor superfamily member 25 isoform X2 [Balearica regulorum gibbericeps]|uniref:tumor necrosis factor receptor superfamily member 25 isoform X2 n=1 Tax=Balearica regulorum gibbericeps TaxID=100784 RepID=UPI003F5DD477